MTVMSVAVSDSITIVGLTATVKPVGGGGALTVTLKVRLASSPAPVVASPSAAV